MRAIAQVLRIEQGDEPWGDLMTVPWLNLALSGDALVGDCTPTTTTYLRRLATEADRLADAIDARLAEKATS